MKITKLMLLLAFSVILNASLNAQGGLNKLKPKEKEKGKSDSQGGRAGGATTNTNTSAPNIDPALKDLKTQFNNLDIHLKESQWGDENWESRIPSYLNKIDIQIKYIEKNWPAENTKPMWEGYERRKTAIAARGGNATDGNAVGSMMSYYKGKAELLREMPSSVSSSFLVPEDPENPSPTVRILLTIDYPALAKRMEEDRSKTPKYFYALKNRLHTPAKGQDLKDGKEAGITTPDEEEINESINKILLWKDKMESAQGECARGVSVCIAKGDQVTHSNDVKMAYYEAAGAMAKSFKSMFPDNPVFDDLVRESNAALDKVMTNFAHLFTGEFHKKNIKKVVGFKSPQIIGKENSADVITEITPGQPFYMIAYFRQTVKELGATKNDPDFGYSVATLPKAFFKESTEDKGVSSFIRLYDVGGKDQPAMKQAYVIYDLLPDPDKTNYKSHLQYLPALHFTKWMLSLTPGVHEIIFGLDANGYDDKFAATTRLKINLDSKGKESLKAYYEKLWAKKLSMVVFPDQYGSTDQQNEIPNAIELAKYGKLIKLTCAQTGTVMKPFPNQTQVNNFVGTGHGLFLRDDGKYEIINLGFSRQPSEQKFRWTGLGVGPDDYTLSSTGYQIKPTLISFGYEIPKENISKTGNWKQ